MTTRWEYRELGLHHQLGDSRMDLLSPSMQGLYARADIHHLPLDRDDWLRQVNELGDDGWEVVGPIVTFDPMPPHEGIDSRLLLKRPRPYTE